MKTKLLSFLLLLLCSPASAFNVDGINYNVTSEENLEAEVGDNFGFSGEAVISSEVEYNGKNYSVTSIGGSAFYNCSSLTSVTIPNSVTSIGDFAFYRCSGLTSVHISDIAAWCKISFSYSDSNPLSCAHHLYLGEEEIKDLVIPNSVTSIGWYAFSGCSGLTSVTIPNSVESISRSAFSGCSGLTSIKVEAGNTVYDSRDNCNAIIRTETNELIYGCKNTVIPNSVTSIGSEAFSGCSGLISLTIPNSVTSIGMRAFQFCSGLTFVTIGSSVTSIGGEAFRGCSGLTSVTIPNSVTDIGGEAFRGCSGLTSMKVEVGNTVFDSRDNCNAIIKTETNELISGCMNTVITNSVTSIGSRAFWECSGLTSITIPNSVTSIGERAFANCI